MTHPIRPALVLGALALAATPFTPLSASLGLGTRAEAAIVLSDVGLVSGGGIVLARRGGDDRAGDDRGGRGRGADDKGADDKGGRRGAEARHGADDGPAHDVGDDRGRRGRDGGRGRGRGADDGPNHR